MLSNTVGKLPQFCTQHSCTYSVLRRLHGIKDEIFNEGTHFVVRHSNSFQIFVVEFVF